MIGGWILPVAWAVLGVTIVAWAVLSRRSRTAYNLGIAAVGVLWVAAGAGANLAMLLTGSTYSGFAGQAWLPVVTDTWESLVVPHHHWWIGLLIGAEALAGLLVLRRGRSRQLALRALIVFNALLVSFGWGFLVWSAPMILGLELLRRSGRRWNDDATVGSAPSDRLLHDSGRRST